MHSVESLINRWRSELSQTFPHQTETIRELEDHLREQIDDLINEGFTPEAAFAESRRRLGDAATLAADFARVNSHWGRVPLSFRVVYVGLGVLDGSLLGWMLYVVGSGRYSPWLLCLQVFVIMSGFLGVLALGALGVITLAKIWNRTLTESGVAAARQAIFTLTSVCSVLVTLGFILGVVWSQSISVRHNAWDSLENGALLVTGWLWLVLVTQLIVPRFQRVRWTTTVLCVVTVVLSGFLVESARAQIPIPWMGLALIFSQTAFTFLSITEGRSNSDLRIAD